MYNGSPNAKILLIVDGLDKAELRDQKPLSGYMIGPLWQYITAQAGYMKSTYYCIPIFNQEIKRSKDGKTIMDRKGIPLWQYCKGHHGYTDEGYDEKRTFERLIGSWLDQHSDTGILVPMGELPYYELTGKIGYRKYRGTPVSEGNYPLIVPTFRVDQVSERAEFLHRLTVIADLRKAKRYSKEPPRNQFDIILPSD